jgi:nitroreductase
MTLYETIFVRRSVRQYDKTPLGEPELSEIREVLDRAERLPGQSARFEIANADALKGCAAPHAILAYGADDDLALTNIGYTLQSADLYLQSAGYGSLWMGMASPKAPQKDYRILLAFGKTSVPLRASEGEFKRKRVSEIGNEDNAVARAARLAPSAANFQPWKLLFSEGKVTVESNPNIVGKLLASKWQPIDLGIVLKHVALALEHDGKIVTAFSPLTGGKAFAVEVRYGQTGAKGPGVV